VKLMQTMAGARHGGAEVFFTRLAGAFARRGVEQTVVIRPEPTRETVLAGEGATIETLPFGGYFDFATARGLRRLIETRQPDIVLSWMNRATRATRRARRGCSAPFIHVARLGGYYDIAYYADCDHLIGNTPDIVDYLVREGWPETRVHYLPNFIDATALPAIPRDTFDTPDDTTLIVAMGRLHENKGFDVLLQALADLPGHILWLAGEGPLRGALENQVDANGIARRVRFLGWRDDIAALLAAADVFVCASRIEPLGNVIIEAWAHGVPVVSSAAEGPSQLIDHDHNGLLVPKEDSSALAAAIRRASAPNLAKALTVAGLASYEATFTEDAVVARYLEFLERVA
jgi:glycosyltransferase involved in cell wall biosynthesis|tara:strand:+ start:753 stop:1787 length:1035 start_codon:yes stop_codon:yes gene_type:complete